MRLSFYLFTITITIISIGGCAHNSIPKNDISNAKMAIAQSDNQLVKKYSPKELKKLKRKYKRINELIDERMYQKAKFLAQELQADALLLQKISSVKKLEQEIKAKEAKLLELDKKDVDKAKDSQWD